MYDLYIHICIVSNDILYVIHTRRNVIAYNNIFVNNLLLDGRRGQSRQRRYQMLHPVDIGGFAMVKSYVRSLSRCHAGL